MHAFAHSHAQDSRLGFRSRHRYRLPVLRSLGRLVRQRRMRRGGKLCYTGRPAASSRDHGTNPRTRTRPVPANWSPDLMPVSGWRNDWKRAESECVCSVSLCRMRLSCEQRNGVSFIRRRSVCRFLLLSHVSLLMFSFTIFNVISRNQEEGRSIDVRSGDRLWTQG